jgi:hypothetical protein
MHRWHFCESRPASQCSYLGPIRQNDCALEAAKVAFRSGAHGCRFAQRLSGIDPESVSDTCCRQRSHLAIAHPGAYFGPGAETPWSAAGVRFR